MSEEDLNDVDTTATEDPAAEVPGPSPFGPPSFDEAKSILVDVYARYIKQLAVRAHPKEPLTFELLDGEHQQAWYVALFEPRDPEAPQ